MMSFQARLRDSRGIERNNLWNVLEWLAMPLLLLYPQLWVLTWYRYGSARLAGDARRPA
jgi:hypothetical protein